jgi:hypothetical protein
MSLRLNVTVVSSKTGGTPGETDAYDRTTTIDRIQQALEAIISEHVPRGQISTVKIHVKKPIGGLRRMVRKTPSILTTTIRFHIALGTISDLDRGSMIRSCQAEVPALVTQNIPADHLCSLVIAVKDAA